MRKDKLIERKESPNLTWEEMHPISYFYYSSDAIERLKEMPKASDLVLLKKEKRQIDQKIEEARGKIKLRREQITSLFHILNELLVRQGEIKKEIESEQKRGGD